MYLSGGRIPLCKAFACKENQCGAMPFHFSLYIIYIYIYILLLPLRLLLLLSLLLLLFFLPNPFSYLLTYQTIYILIPHFSCDSPRSPFVLLCCKLLTQVPVSFVGLK
ncbi:conserved hypothetical protein, unlikely [Trypanosoma brucei gambiense DAL972]|uniref:Uncharacterized protein n=1 Tax=Trypanosoma brucei gambiense (strain MHOM/CI/86/DAL972) TaxID=679716 RepID=C9ZYF3_TRYB9|nr:conserved hypothetical protein, unlikely [Trypanosoma brucei gambiense DAL972]CBH14452.1 conserved hypothetical protein, unlikely [Trypanosoma brucei gambiense DAL972]|eukprot:XP_011776718.1 conserved hypothetical protein, unlikely [Trypanosoma brucei gambiense DAL972]